MPLLVWSFNHRCFNKCLWHQTWIGFNHCLTTSNQLQLRTTNKNSLCGLSTKAFRADSDYASIARYIGLSGKDDRALKDALVQKIVDLAHGLGIKLSLKDNYINKKEFDENVDSLSEAAFGDQFSFTNPKEPLISELKQILEDMYVGKGIEK
jgi:Alcohol dehydrogenase, class IV